MHLREITGQKGIIGKLIRSVKEERVSHAQILAGPEGCGKLAIAIAFAGFVSCEDKQENDSCGTCPSCVKYSRLIHPDLHFVFPVFKKNRTKDPISDHFITDWRSMINESTYFNLNQWLANIGVENEQGLIYASEANEIIKKLSLKTYESDYKIMIIWLPEKMHQAAANKLLKMIEEPPGKTLFLLVSEEPDLLLPTILSRCQFVRIPAISKVDLTKELMGKFNYSQEKAGSLAHISNGNYTRAISLIKEDEARAANLKSFIELMRLTWKKDVPALAEWSDDMSRRGRETQKGFLTFGLVQLRENFMMNIGQDENKLVYLGDEEVAFAKKFSSFIHEKNINLLSSEFTLANSHIAANGNPKIVFLDLALNIVKYIRVGS